MATRIAFIAFGIASFVAACANAHNMVGFGYSGELSKWGSLSPDYAVCSQGKLQSPINIVKVEAEADSKLKPLDRDYNPVNATLIDNGYNVMMKFDTGVGSVGLDGKNYTLRQLHWHSPSEHTVDGIQFPAEMQLVHVSDDGGIAVVAILYQYGDPDPFLAKLQDKVGELAAVNGCSLEEEAHVAAGVIDTKSLRRSSRKYYRYVGSLTTPPCTENVIWTILGKVRDISQEQVNALVAPMAGEYRKNARPTQPLNSRKVTLYSEGDEDDEEESTPAAKAPAARAGY